MTIIEALQNALAFLEALGYTGGDVHDDLDFAVKTMIQTSPATARTRIGRLDDDR